jgi:hypothetical protein
MSNVVQFKPKTNSRPTTDLGGLIVEVPTTRVEYLKLCKTVLERHDYEEVLMAIMDAEIYENVDKAIRNIVDSYFTFS